MAEKIMLERKTWEEFRNIGLLWFTNRFLHLFSWAIAFEVDDAGKFTEAYPARCKFRGFSSKSETEGFIKVTKYLKDNINELEKETKE